MMRQSDTDSNSCGVVAMFPEDTSRHTGYNAGLGWWDKYFGYGFPAPHKNAQTHDTKEWHTVRINAAADGEVYFYLDGELQRQVTQNTYQSGVIRLGINCKTYEYKNLVVKEG